MRKKTSEYIEKMRQRPRHVQQRHAVGIAALVTTFIFFIWLPLAIVNFSGQEEGEVAQSERSDVQLFEKGMASVGSGFKQTLNVLRGKASEQGSIQYSRVSTSDDDPYGPPLVPVTGE